MKKAKEEDLYSPEEAARRFEAFRDAPPMLKTSRLR